MARSYEVGFTEPQWDIIIELLNRQERVCRKNARMARKMGYGTVQSLSKSDEWEKKGDEIKNMVGLHN